MNTGVISKRYAKALYEFAGEGGRIKQVYTEMCTLFNSYLQVPELRTALDNPLLSMDEKQKLLCSAAGGNVSTEVQRFVALVLKEHREAFMQFMACSYIDLYRKQNNILEARLITAAPVGKEIEDRMRMMIVKGTQATVEFDTLVEPSIIGGFILDVDFERLDASVASQFRRVRRQLMENKRIVVQ